jgi:hypothetical protein
MRNTLFYIALAVMLPVLALGGVRCYQVEPYQNCSGWTPREGFVSQSFVNTADTIKWVEFFVGAANERGRYQVTIRSESDQQCLYLGYAKSGPAIHDTFVRAELRPATDIPLVRDGRYLLSITCESGDSISFGYNPNNTCTQGRLIVPGTSVSDSYDLCARIEGVDRVDEDPPRRAVR